MTTQEAFVDSVSQDQTAQNVQFCLWSTLCTVIFIIDYNEIVSSSWNRSLFSANEKIRFIYSEVKGLNVILSFPNLGCFRRSCRAR